MNDSFPWLSVMAAVPLVGILAIALTAWLAPQSRQRAPKLVALAASVVTLALSVVVAIRFDPSAAGANGPGAFQFTESYSWIPAFGVHYGMGLDGVGLVLVLMTTVLVPVVVLASWHDVDAVDGAEGADGAGGVVAASRRAAGRSAVAYFGLVLLLETMVLVAFCATDVFFFYVFFEAMLVPMYFLIGRFGGPKRTDAAVKFLVYNLLGGLIMLVAVIGLYVMSARQLPQGTFDLPTLVHAISSGQLHIDSGVANALFLGFFFAFAVKAPLWPFHTWLPDAAAEATPGNAVLMVAVMDKLGTFGMIRYCLPLFPGPSHTFTPAIIVLAVIGVIYGALLAIGQTDIKRLIGYTSISHFGFIILGIFAMTSQGQSGSALYMVNHGFATAALFLVAGFLISRRGSRLIEDYGGVQKVAPLLAGSFLVAGLANLSLPGLSTFVSEFLVLLGTFTRYRAAAIVAALGIVLAAIYVLWLYQRTMTGPLREKVPAMRDLNRRELLVVAPLVAVIVALGVFPKPILDIINPAVSTTLHQVGSTDPQPTVGAVPGPGGGTGGGSGSGGTGGGGGTVDGSVISGATSGGAR